MRFGSDRQGNPGRRDRCGPAGTTGGDAGRQAAASGGADGGAAPPDADRLFRILGVHEESLSEATTRAAENGTSAERELFSSGIVEPTAFYAGLAALLGVPFLRSIAPGKVIASAHIDSILARPERVFAEIGGRLRHIVAPAAGQVGPLARLVADKPALRERLAVATPEAIRSAVWDCRAEERAREAVRTLFERGSGDSARTVVTGSQGFAFGIVLTGLAVAAIVAPGSTLLAIHLFLSVFFFSCVALRVAAFLARRRPSRRFAEEELPGPLPKYTILVALYDEAAVAAQLVASLRRLRWPRTLIEIKLICEADDTATIEALEATRPGPEFEIVKVPKIGPRTKPKALCYALSGVGGDYLVIYDAEDRPHPDQLLEAHAIFRQTDPTLAYLQAPLVITNARLSGWSAVFALEYAGLFRGLLPFLARRGLPLPLGGTSNHFRMEALKACGAWDPHNVTEDADLGLRLFRKGYRGGVLSRATQETAPAVFDEWVRQRTRWLKGWLQTWLVLMRAPMKLRRDMGLVPFVVFQVLIGGMLLSALGHPLLIGCIGLGIAKIAYGDFLPGSPLHGVLFGVDTINVLGCYVAFVLLARKAMVPEERRRVGYRWIFLPIYWLAMSYAAWRAILELARKPFYWAKTPHRPDEEPGADTQT